MGKLLLDQFKNYVRDNYFDHNITAPIVCSALHCSKSYLNEVVMRDCGYSFMKYIENYRILKAIELMCVKREKHVYLYVGYNTSSVFSKAFLRVTGFNASCFYAYELAEHKDIFPIIFNTMASENPRRAIGCIINDTSIRYLLLESSKREQPHNQKNKRQQTAYMEETGIKQLKLVSC